ncbi:MAG: helix-turn-helix transcriptional regulator [Alphaproteobacteria bacterium]|nr:helix-turn-helix transcriptional regulator [Alphaproteobacteria bacterium]
MNNKFAITDIKRVILVGKDEYKEKVTSFSKNSNCKNELIYHLSGKSIVVFNGKQLETTEDTIRFLPAGEINEYTVDRIERGECIDIVFDTNMPITDEAFVSKLKQSEKIKSLFKRIFAVWVAKEDGYYFECVSIIYKIFAELQKKNYIPENQFDAIKPAIQYIENHFLKKRITAEEITFCCKISYPYIKKLFVKKFGMPPIKYSIQLKINYACDLLKSEQYTISQIAEICGYNDIYFFSRQFKEYMGLSPTDFINKYKSSK